MAITCCYGCVAPKRHPGCHDHCPEYNEERILAIVDDAERKKRKNIEDGLKASKLNVLKSAVKRSGKKWGE